MPACIKLIYCSSELLLFLYLIKVYYSLLWVTLLFLVILAPFAGGSFCTSADSLLIVKYICHIASITAQVGFIKAYEKFGIVRSSYWDIYEMNLKVLKLYLLEWNEMELLSVKISWKKNPIKLKFSIKF